MSVSNWAGSIVAISSTIIAVLAWVTSQRQVKGESKARLEEPAREAVSYLFSREMAGVRFSLYDKVCEVAAAASGELDLSRRMELCREFAVGRESEQMPTRYFLARRWANREPSTAAMAEYRSAFLEESAALLAAFDSIAKAAESSVIAADYVRRRVGRLMVWWQLVWPGLFDHTDAYIFRQFLADPRVRDNPPATSAAYTQLWRRQAMWSQDDWEGAVENYRSLTSTMMPGDPWRNRVKLDIEESIYGLVGDPLLYPSRRPSDAYLVDGAYAHRLHWSWDLSQVTFMETGESVEAFLEDRGETLLGSRIPQIAFGANRDLTNLAWKFANYQPADDVRTSKCLIVLPGVVRDADVVACNIGYWGYVYAALAIHKDGIVDRSYLKGATAPVSVLLLDDDQMAAMHESEGVLRPGDETRPDVSCDVAIWDVESYGRTFGAQLYALALPYLSFDGDRPVGFDSVSTRNTSLERMTQVEMWNRIITSASDLDLRDHEQDPHQLVEMMRTGARNRMRYGQGTADRSQYVYESLRRHIAENLALYTPRGEIDMATRSLPVLPVDDAWMPGPRMSGMT